MLLRGTPLLNYARGNAFSSGQRRR